MPDKKKIDKNEPIEINKGYSFFGQKVEKDSALPGVVNTASLGKIKEPRDSSDSND